jgi:tetratricopeptide (TPR) repeat protein
MAEDDSDLRESAERLLELGWIAREAAQPDQAHQMFHRSLRLAQHQGDKRNEARALLALADNALHCCLPRDCWPLRWLLQLIGRSPLPPNAFDRREWYARESLQLFREIGDREGIADSMVMLSGQVKYHEAIQLLEESIALSREAGYVKGTALGLLRLGQTMSLNGDKEHGLQHMREALAVARDGGAKKDIASALVAIAVVADSDVERLSAYEEAIPLYREIGGRFSLAEVLHFAAMAYSRRGDVQRQEACLEQSLALFCELGNTFHAEFCVRDMARIARERGDLARANALEAQCRPEITCPSVSAGLQDQFVNADRDGKMDYIKRRFG